MAAFRSKQSSSRMSEWQIERQDKTRIPEDSFRTLCFAQGFPALYTRKVKIVMVLETLGENGITFLVAGPIKKHQQVDCGYGVVRECTAT